MPLTLFETLSQIDPYVQLNDGCSVLTVRKRVLDLDLDDEDEYAMFVDSIGRLVIFKLDHRGRMIHPAMLVEQKAEAVPGQSNGTVIPGDFGIPNGGFV